jgi:hypothetical protein
MAGQKENTKHGRTEDRAHTSEDLLFKCGVPEDRVLGWPAVPTTTTAAAAARG